MLIEPPLTTDQIHEIILEICESQETNLAYSHHIKNLTRHITFREKELNQAKAETRLYKDRTSFELVSDLQQLTQQLATANAERDSFAQSYDNIDHRQNVLTEKHQSLTTLCAELAEALKACHDKMSEECIVYFEQDGKPIEISTNLGEAYQESEMFEANLKALAHYAELLKKKE